MNDWVTGNRFLGSDDMKHNGILVYKELSKYGFSVNAIAGILGNLEAESTINPGIWEGLQPYIGGYGLVQWTPYEKYSDWAGENWQNNGDKECERIAYEFENGIQYYATDTYAVSAHSFRISSDMPEYLAGAFMHNYERPASYATEPYRKERARWWYDLLTSSDIDFNEDSQPKPPTEEPHQKGGRLWLYTRQD